MRSSHLGFSTITRVWQVPKNPGKRPERPLRLEIYGLTHGAKNYRANVEFPKLIDSMSPDQQIREAKIQVGIMDWKRLFVFAQELKARYNQSLQSFLVQGKKRLWTDPPYFTEPELLEIKTEVTQVLNRLAKENEPIQNWLGAS